MKKIKRPKKSVLIDSSVWISSFIQEEENYLKAGKIINYHLNKKFIILVPKIVMLEVINVVYKKSKSVKLAENFILNVFQNPLFACIDIPAKLLARTSLKLLQKISIKSSDFYIILFKLIYRPKYFETFDLKQLKCYRQIK